MIDDKEEILAVTGYLERHELYGAAQMIYRLARERDEARAMLAHEPATENPGEPWYEPATDSADKETVK